jgi:MFS family permease
MISWGKLSDRIGRKPVLVVSLYGISISMALFGFSTTIWQMVFFRTLAGVFSGSVVFVAP